MTSIAETPEAATHRCCVTVLKHFAKVTGQHLRLISFIIKLQPFSSKNTEKVPQHIFFLWTLHKLSEQLFYAISTRLDGRITEKQKYYRLYMSLITSFFSDVTFLFSACKCVNFWLLRRCLAVLVFSTLSQIRLMNSENYNEINVHVRGLNQWAIL